MGAAQDLVRSLGGARRGDEEERDRGEREQDPARQRHRAEDGGEDVAQPEPGPEQRGGDGVAGRDDERRPEEHKRELGGDVERKPRRPPSRQRRAVDRAGEAHEQRQLRHASGSDAPFAQPHPERFAVPQEEEGKEFAVHGPMRARI